MRRLLSQLVAVVFGLGSLSLAAGAQATPPARTALPIQLRPETRSLLAQLLDSARVLRVPIAPLTDKAAEGVLKGADDARVVAAVRSLFREMAQARAIVGDSASDALLGAAASTLHAGVTPPDLRRIVRPRNGMAADPNVLATALITLVDFVARHVPLRVASSAIDELLERNAGDAQFATLRSQVEGDILAGRSPEASVATRLRAQTRILDTPSPAVPGRRPKPPLPQ
jgi:hypothetical protein